MITAYVKATNRCNVGCSHCYLPEAVRADRTRMTDDILRQVATFLAEMRERGRHAGVHFLWHGGEPLVLPAKWYEHAQGILDELLPERTESMQTSLIPLRPEHVDLIRDRMGSFVGSSVDFSQRRIGGSVEKYHDLWMKKVDMAREGGIMVVPGVVPTTREVGDEGRIVSWFVDRGFDAFNVDRYNAYGTEFPDRPSNAQHARFLSGLFTALMKRMRTDGRAPLVGATRAAITGVLFGVGGDRWGGSCMNDFVVFEPDGSLNNCPDKSSFEESFGFAADGFKAFAASKFRRKWLRHQAVTHKQSHCTGCENAHFCGSGCPITPNGEPEGEDECSGYHSHLSDVRRFTATPEGRALAVAYINQTQGADDLGKASVYGRSTSECAA